MSMIANEGGLIVLVVDPDGTIAGATSGNDVNLRDIEGRSALRYRSALELWNYRAAAQPCIARSTLRNCS